MNSLALVTDPSASDFWDLALVPSAGGVSLSVATGGAALAQNAATALDTFQGECWYDASLGMPYLQQVFGGGLVPLAYLKTKIQAVAGAVAGVASAAAYLSGPNPGRQVTGQVQLTSATGEPVSPVGTTNLAGALPWYVNAAPAYPTVITGGGQVITGGGQVITP